MVDAQLRERPSIASLQQFDQQVVLELREDDAFLAITAVSVRFTSAKSPSRMPSSTIESPDTSSA